MSVEPSELISEAWTRWQGHLVNYAYPLGRYLGGSDHSGVFLTKSATRGPSQLAVKLVPTDRALAESQLPRWKRASRIAHPHLLPLLEWGGCQLEGLPYLYAVMEFADQTLAQLLSHRALTDDEAREMLLPILEALAFLHGRNLVQGQLKPANILVVGDQLKLASDTIRRVRDGAMSTNTPTAYDAPERRHGNISAAGDIWALGVSLCEALTRRPPSGLSEHTQAPLLPPHLSPVFRDVVTRCLSARPEDRPTVTELLAWVRGEAAESVPRSTSQAAALAILEPTASEPTASEPTASEPTASEPTASGPIPSEPKPRKPPAPTQPTAPESAPARAPTPQSAADVSPGEPSVAKSPNPRVLLSVIVGGVLVLALGWAGVRALKTDGTPASSPPAVQAAGGSLSATASAAVPAVETQPSVPASSASGPGRGDALVAPSVLHEVIPEVPRPAARTIRGHVKVWVRVIVAQDGAVFAAVTDRAGPSRYFERLAVDAAKKWTFPPADTSSRRLMQVRFDFTRDGATARAVPLH
jgi:serine/threonine protein kinase